MRRLFLLLFCLMLFTAPCLASDATVSLEDQDDSIFETRFSRVLTGPYTLSEDTYPGEYTINLTNATGLVATDNIGLFQNSANPAAYFGEIESISTNSLTMDTPLDEYFTSNNSAVLFELDQDLAADGSTTPVIFSITNDADVDLDVTSVLISMVTATQPDHGKFGDLTELDNGIVLRKNNGDGTYQNYFTVKKNADFSLLTYDVDYYDQSKKGVYGIGVKLTFAGQEKHGAVIRLSNGQSLELVVQDNITGLPSFEMMAQGHINSTESSTLMWLVTLAAITVFASVLLFCYKNTKTETVPRGRILERTALYGSGIAFALLALGIPMVISFGGNLLDLSDWTTGIFIIGGMVVLATIFSYIIYMWNTVGKQSDKEEDD